MEQEPCILVSLYEYFPNDFFQQCFTAAYHMVEVEIKKPSIAKVIAVKEEKTLKPKESLPALLRPKEALQLPKEMQKALVTVLASPDDYKVQESKDEALKIHPYEYTTCYATHDAIDFTDKDFLLGS
ncbi:hypothetical protein TB2_027355 [Malus domestica]